VKAAERTYVIDMEIVSTRSSEEGVITEEAVAVPTRRAKEGRVARIRMGEPERESLKNGVFWAHLASRGMAEARPRESALARLALAFALCSRPEASTEKLCQLVREEKGRERGAGRDPLSPFCPGIWKPAIEIAP